MAEFEKRRVASMVEMTPGGDMDRINDIVTRYQGPESDKQGKSEGKKSIGSNVKDSSQESKNLLNKFKDEINN